MKHGKLEAKLEARHQSTVEVFASNAAVAALKSADPDFRRFTTEEVRQAIIKALTPRLVRTLEEDPELPGHFAWSSFTYAGVTLAIAIDLQPRPVGHPLRNTVSIQSLQEAIEDAMSEGSMALLASVLENSEPAIPNKATVS